MSHTIHSAGQADDEVIVLELPWQSPPLSMNDRMHHLAKGRLVREVRKTAADLAQRTGIGSMVRPSLQLVWLVTTRHKRDTDNVVPTLKALADGIVDAGVAADDTPEFMHKGMPIISYAKGNPKAPGMFLVIWEAGGETADELLAMRALRGAA